MLRLHIHDNSQGFVVTIGIILLVLVAIIGGVITLTHDKDGTHLKIINGCKDTDITVKPITMASLNSPVTLKARLTIGGQPVIDERITFRLISKDSQGRNLQLLEGYATTDASGVGTLSKSNGFADDLITLGKSGTVSGYEATFDGASAIKQNEPFYCGARATANITFQQQ